MRTNDFRLNLNDISLESNKKNYETIFSLSNGFLGTRGSKEEDFLMDNEADQGTFINGFYESEPIVYGESAYGYAKKSQTIVRVPNAKQLIFSFNGTPFSEGQITNEEYFLDLKNGLLHRSFIWSTSKGEEVKVETERFVSMINRNNLFIKYSVRPLSVGGEFIFNGSFSTKDGKNVDDDDPRKAKSVNHSIVTKVNESTDGLPYLITETLNSNLRIKSSLSITSKTSFTDLISQITKTGFDYSLIKEVSKDETFDLNIQATYSDIEKVNQEGIEYKHDKNLSYQLERTKHIKYWNEFWNKSDISLVGDDTLQKGIRHNLFHLNQAAGRDGKTNISAKGLTSDGYEGHYFWDTEMYMIPFFIFTQPDIAKQLLLYRYSVLDKAKERARELGIDSGVLFSWRTINGEECSAYYPAGTAQVHINGDIAYAIQTYVDVTGDNDFMLEFGAEMLVEVARFWLSFGCFKEGQFMINGVTGPDEYTALVNNNFYTNKLARYNLECAIKIMENMELCSKFNVTTEEIKLWQEAASKMRLPYDEELELTLQDDGMIYRDIWPFDKTPKDKYPLLLNYHPMMIYKHQVNKQADTILSQYLFENDFTKDQLKRDYHYYESVTTHDSSLSRSIFSIMATRINQTESGYNYFMDTVGMDLNDIQGNTIDGIHAANLGGMWLSLVKGFGGISILDGTINIDPHLPEKWEELEFKIQYRKSGIKMTLTKDLLKIVLEYGEPLNMIIRGKSYLLKDMLAI